MNFRIRILSMLLALGTSGAAADSEKLAFFHAEVLPLLEETCYKCHSHESGKSKGGLMVDSAKALRTGGNSGDSIVPGKPEESLLYQAVAYLDEDMEMPPKKNCRQSRSPSSKSGTPGSNGSRILSGSHTSYGNFESSGFWSGTGLLLNEPRYE